MEVCGVRGCADSARRGSSNHSCRWPKPWHWKYWLVDEMDQQASVNLHLRFIRMPIVVPSVTDLPGRETITRPLLFSFNLLTRVSLWGACVSVNLVACSISVAMAAPVSLELPQPFHLSSVVGTQCRTKWDQWLLVSMLTSMMFRESSAEVILSPSVAHLSAEVFGGVLSVIFPDREEAAARNWILR